MEPAFFSLRGARFPNCEDVGATGCPTFDGLACAKLANLGSVPMRLRVLFFGMLKDLVGISDTTLDLPESATVGDLLAHFASEVPQLKDSLSSLAVAVNQQYAGTEIELKSGDEVALLPPVSGGRGEPNPQHSKLIREPNDTA